MVNTITMEQRIEEIHTTHEHIRKQAAELGFDADTYMRDMEDYHKSIRTWVYQGPGYHLISFYPDAAEMAAYDEEPERRVYFKLYIPGVRYQFRTSTAYPQRDKAWLGNVLHFIPRGRHRELIKAWALPNGSCFGSAMQYFDVEEKSVADILNIYWNTGFNLDADINYHQTSFFNVLWAQTDDTLAFHTRVLNALQLWENMSPGDIITAMSKANKK